MFAMLRLLHVVLAALLVCFTWGLDESGGTCIDRVSSPTVALIQQRQSYDRTYHASVNEALEVVEDSKKVSSGFSTHQSECVKQYADGLDQVHSGLGDKIRAHPGTVVATTDRSIIFGVGSGTTGTWGLTKALHRMAQPGKKVSHWLNSPPENCKWIRNLLRAINLDPEECRNELRSFDFTAIADSVSAVLDMPVYELFVDFFLSFPKASWILTTRPSGSWAKRRKEKHLNSAFPVQEPCGLKINKNTSEEDLGTMFELTNGFIKCMVPPGRLLELDMFSSNITDTAVQDITSFLSSNDYTIRQASLLSSMPLDTPKQLPEEECKDGEDAKKSTKNANRKQVASSK